MPKIPSKPRELPPVGTYPAVCVGFYDMGTQVQKNPDFEDTRQCQVPFELGNIKKSDGKPFVIAWRGTYSSWPTSKLAKTFFPWLGVKSGEGVDTEDFLGRQAMVQITHSKDGNYANIEGVMQPVKGTKPVKPSTAPSSLYLTDELFDQDTFDSLTDRQKELIKSSPEYQEVMRSRETPAPKKAAGKEKAKAKK